MSRSHQIVTRYVQFLHRFRFVILLFWVGACVACGFFVGKFLSSTSADFNAPTNSPSQIAQREQDRLFPQQTLGDPEHVQVLIELNNNDNNNNDNRETAPACPFLSVNFTLASPLIAPVIEAFTLQLQSLLQRHINETDKQHADSTLEIASYVDFVRRGATLYADQFLATKPQERSAILLPVVYTQDASKRRPAQTSSTDEGKKVFANFAQQQVAKLSASILQDAGELKKLISSDSSNKSPTTAAACTPADYLLLASSFSASTTGMTLMSQEMIKAGKHEMEMSDTAVIPIALLIMAVVVRSLRLLILPILSLGGSLLCSFALMSAVAQHMPVSTATPSLQMSLCIAVSIDWNLFLTSSYVQEVRDSGHKGAAAVVATLESAGATILLSGITFIFSVVSLSFFPNDLIRSYGISAVTTIGCAMLISLLLTPTLLILFPSFFEESAKDLKETWIYRSCLAPYLLCWCVKDSNDDGINNQNQNTRGSLQSPWRGDDEDGNSSVAAQANYTTPLVNNNDGNNNNNSNLTGHSLSTLGGGGINPSGVIHSGTLYFDTPLVGGGGGGVVARKLSSNIEGGGGGGSKSPRTPNSNSNRNSARALGGATDSEIMNNSNNPAVGATRSSFYQTTGGAAFHEALVNSSIFGRCLAPVLQFPFNLIIVIVILAVVGLCGWQATQIRVTNDLMNYLPRGSEQRAIFTSLEEAFGYAIVAPLDLMFEIKKAEDENGNNKNNKNSSSSSLSIISNESLVLVEQVLRHMAHETNTPLDAFQSVFWLDGRSVGADVIQACLHNATTPSCDPNVLVQLDSMLNTPANTAVIVRVTRPPVNPVGYKANSYYHNLLAAAKWRPESTTATTTENRLNVYVVGSAPSMLDALDSIYSRFVWIGVSAAAAVLLIVGIAFRSIVVPLRCLVTIAATQATVFGLLVLVYQKNGLGWLSSPAVGETGAISWLVPIVTVAIVTAIALDYDIFLLLHIQRFVVRDGMATDVATLLALCSANSVITAAGAIMSVAFFGMCLSNMRTLNEMGFALMIAVLFDTFIVRTLLQPAMICLLGRWHWWPSNPEQTNYVESAALLPSGIFTQEHDTMSSTVGSARLYSGRNTGGGSPIRGSPIRNTNNTSSSLQQTAPLNSSTAFGGLARSPRDQVNSSRHRLDALQNAAT